MKVSFICFSRDVKSLSSKVTMHVLFSAAVIACPLQTTYFPGSDSLILDTKTVHSKEDKGKLQSWRLRTWRLRTTRHGHQIDTNSIWGKIWWSIS